MLICLILDTRIVLALDNPGKARTLQLRQMDKFDQDKPQEADKLDKPHQGIFFVPDKSHSHKAEVLISSVLGMADMLLELL